MWEWHQPNWCFVWIAWNFRKFWVDHVLSHHRSLEALRTRSPWLKKTRTAAWSLRMYTLPETNSEFTLQMDAWKTIVSFWGPANFQGWNVSFREGISYLEKCTAWKGSMAIATPISIGLLRPLQIATILGVAMADRHLLSLRCIYVWLEKLHVHNLLRIAFSKSHRLRDSSRWPFKQKLHVIYLED